MRLLKIEIAAALAFIICIFAGTYKLDKDCDGIRQGILRLHVVAASDSKEDQSLKLQLRDELLLKGREIFSPSDTKREAQTKINDSLKEIQACAEAFLVQKNNYQGVSVSLEKSYFPTRKYEGFTLPAGYYDALKVVLGKGEGQNWWCIMFPSLCLPAATQTDKSFDGILTDPQKEFIVSDRYEIRFWLVEKWQELQRKFIYNN